MNTRFSIALGAARAIVHLHSLNPPTCHGNIKSSNVLLTRTFDIRVSDFGIAKVAGASHIDGYHAPEATDTGKVSQKADVYSHGILLMELLTGKDPNAPHLKDEGIDLPRWILSAVDDNQSSGVFDPELFRYPYAEEDMVQLLKLAFICTAEDADNRPSMAEVHIQIEKLSAFPAHEVYETKKC